MTRVTKESSESSTQGKRWYQRLFSRHSSRQERMVKQEPVSCIHTVIAHYKNRKKLQLYIVY